MKYNLGDIYKEYVLRGGTLSKNDFKNICQDFNIHICNHLIYDAGIFDMGSRLSTLEVIRIERDYKKRRVDWKASLENRQELMDKGVKLYDKHSDTGTKWLVYQDEPEFVRFYWKRKACTIPNNRVYQLIMTRGEMGNKTKLKEHLYEHELNYLKYRQQ